MFFRWLCLGFLAFTGAYGKSGRLYYLVSNKLKRGYCLIKLLNVNKRGFSVYAKSNHIYLCCALVVGLTSYCFQCLPVFCIFLTFSINYCKNMIILFQFLKDTIDRLSKVFYSIHVFRCEFKMTRLF